MVKCEICENVLAEGYKGKAKKVCNKCFINCVKASRLYKEMEKRIVEEQVRSNVKMAIM